MSCFLTFTTDFGTKDGFVAQMKGVVLKKCAHAVLVDITHDIDPFNIEEAALVLRGVFPYFPPATVHLAVVDPGVGGPRRGIVVRAHEQFFVGPDNGLFSWVLQEADSWEAREIANPDVCISSPHPTFHGRDVFAPVGAALASGYPFDSVGPIIEDLVSFSMPSPISLSDGLAGEIVHVDRFGNLCSNIEGKALSRSVATITVGNIIIRGLSTFFSEVPEGHPLALINSFGLLEIAVNRGSAADILALGRGAPVRIIWS